MTSGLDCASPLSATSLRRAVAEGHTFVLRYAPPSAYQMSQTECAAIRAAGLAVGHIFEVQADRSLRGANQGATDGATLDRYADDCGAPRTCRLLYNAVDFDASLAQLRGPVADYARAFDQACRRPTMPYGPYTTMEVLCGEQRIAPFGWQCAGYSGSGSGSGGSYRCSDGSVRRLSKYAAMFQDVGYVLNGAADRNVVLREPVDWAWPLQAPPSPEENDVIDTVTADGLDGIWFYALDGWGRERRIHVVSPAAQRALARMGVIRGGTNPAPSIKLEGEEADWFKGLLEGNALGADWGALKLKEDGVTETADAVVTQLVDGLEIKVTDKVTLTDGSVAAVAKAVNDEAHARSAE